MDGASLRAFLGFLAAVISVLTFHQGMIALLHTLAIPGLEIRGLPYPTDPVPPFQVPRIISLCFWGGLYGAVFGLLAPGLPRPLWLSGIATGLVAAVIGMFVVPVLKGTPVGGGDLHAWIRSFVINGSFGLGLGIIYPLAASPSRRRRAH